MRWLFNHLIVTWHCMRLCIRQHQCTNTWQFFFGFFYWCHYNSLRLKNWHCYLPILNYTIIFLLNYEICHALGQPRPWDHLQAYVAYGENRMDRNALVQTGQMAWSASRLHSSLTPNPLLARSSSKNHKWRQQLGRQWFLTAAHQTKTTGTMLGLEKLKPVEGRSYELELDGGR